MNKLSYYITQIIERDLANQMIVTSKELPRLSSVIVQISFKSNFFNLTKTIAFIVFVLEFLTGQKPKFSYSKADVSYWKLRKKQLVSIHTTLKGPAMFFFIEKFLFTFLSKLPNIFFITFPNSSAFCYFISNFIIFNELERESIGFNKKNSILSKFNISVTFVFEEFNIDTIKNSLFYVNQIQFPVKK